jgi:poly-gamma-glutamate synthesis protein (capsule biosynthesis protein)
MKAKSQIKLILLMLMATISFSGCKSISDSIWSGIETMTGGKDDVVQDTTTLTPRLTSAAGASESGLEADNPEGTTSDASIDDVNPVTISFVGDVFTSEQMYKNYTESGITGVVSENILDIFQNSDIMVANHEYCSTDLDDTNALSFQKWIEQSATKNEFLLNKLGIDVVSVANNHIFDYGEQGFIDTLNGIKNLGITYVGGGLDFDDATNAKVVNAENKSIAFFASNEVITDTEWIVTDEHCGMNGLYDWSDTYTKMLENIGKASASDNIDLVVVMLHFGTEKQYEQTTRQELMAKACIDAGADIVIGSHAHVVQGIEYYNGGMIFYGLGNFLFSNYQSDTMLVTITLNQDDTYSAKIIPCSSYLYYTQDVTTSTVFDLLNTYSPNAAVRADGSVYRITKVTITPEPDNTESDNTTIDNE